MKLRGNLFFVFVILFVFCFSSCSQDKSLNKFQKTALGSWSLNDEIPVEVTKDKIILQNIMTILYRIDKSKIYLIFGDEYEQDEEWYGLDYNVLSRDSFKIIINDDDSQEFKFIDKNTISVSRNGHIMRFKRIGS